jgi:hypothetical protein
MHLFLFLRSIIMGYLPTRGRDRQLFFIFFYFFPTNLALLTDDLTG